MFQQVLFIWHNVNEKFWSTWYSTTNTTFSCLRHIIGEGVFLLRVNSFPSSFICGFKVVTCIHCHSPWSETLLLKWIGARMAQSRNKKKFVSFIWLLESKFGVMSTPQLWAKWALSKTNWIQPKVFINSSSPSTPFVTL